jgi:hypothetical protein
MKHKSIMHSDAAIAAYQAVLGSGVEVGGRRLDAGNTVGFARAFEFIEAGILKMKFGLVQWRSIFGAPETGPSWLEYTTYRQSEDYGDADWVDEMATDYPGVGIVASESTQPVRALGSSFTYSVDEIAKFAVLGMDVNLAKAAAARRAIEQKVDLAMAVGNSDRNIPSFVTNASLTATTASTKTGGGTVWSSYTGGATGAQVYEILGDVMRMSAAIDTNTKFSFGPAPRKVLVVGTKGWTFLKNTFMSTTNYLRETFGEFLLRNVPDLGRIEYWPQLDTVGAGGKERIMMWIDDADVAKATLYVDMQMSAPIPQGFHWIVKCRSKTAGVKVKNWTAITYMDSTQP